MIWSALDCPCRDYSEEILVPFPAVPGRLLLEHIEAFGYNRIALAFPESPVMYTFAVSFYKVVFIISHFPSAVIDITEPFTIVSKCE